MVGTSQYRGRDMKGIERVENIVRCVKKKSVFFSSFSSQGLEDCLQCVSGVKTLPSLPLSLETGFSCPC